LSKTSREVDDSTVNMGVWRSSEKGKGKDTQVRAEI
jgi:hypothetical protein